jgi:predicted Zn-dependent protease
MGMPEIAMSDPPAVSIPVSAALPPLASDPPASRRSLRRSLEALMRHGRHWLRRPWRLLGIGVLLGVIGLGCTLAGVYGRAYFHFRSGRADLERHHNAEALAHLQSYLRTWPNDAAALLLAARASWRLQQFAEAERYLKQYQQAAGSSDDFVRECFLVRAARGEVDEAAKYCQDRLENKDPAAPLILEALVSGCMRQYRLAEGAAFLQHWLDLKPDDTQALLFQIGFDRLRQRPEEAIARYRRVLELDPEHDSARLQLAATLVETRQYQEAFSTLEGLRQRQPDNAQVLVLLAQCQDFLGQQAVAEQLLDQVLAREPHHAAALAARGRLALRSGRFADAEAWLRHALVHEPGNYQARYQLAECLLQRGQTDEAVRQEQGLRQLEKDQKRFRLIVTQEMSRKPHDPALHHELAMILLRRGDVEGGLRWLHNALRGDPTSVPLHRALAEYYQQTGDEERAARHRQFVPPQAAEPAHRGP